jgi:S1-C subfamily serine protease
MISTFRVAAFAGLAVLAACAPVNTQRNTQPGQIGITYKGVRYTDPQAAADAQRLDGEAVVAGLPKQTDPILGKVRIVLPDHDRLRPFAASSAANAGYHSALIDVYFNDLDDAMLRVSADALTRTNAFKSAQVVVQNDTINPDSAGADFVVWFQVFAQARPTGTVWLGRWLVRRGNEKMAQLAGYDAGRKAYSPEWFESFLANVREAALRLGATTAAGAKPKHAVALNGSGLVVDTDGHVLTNNHVIPACKEIHVFDGTSSTTATVVARDVSNDLALLKIAKHDAAAAVFRDSTNLRAGENVVVTGYPLPGLVSSEMSITTGSLTALKGPRDDTRLLQISAPIQPGNSGGPALDDAGDVIGIVSSTLNALALAVATGGAIPQGVNFAIKTSLVEEFLDSNGIHYAHTETHRGMSNADIADKARKFTVRVECR